MVAFYNAETSEPVRILYIASSGNGNVVLKDVPRTALGMRLPQVVVEGPGTATADYGRNPKSGEYRWSFTGLTTQSSIRALDGKGNLLLGIPVKPAAELDSFKAIHRRFNRRGMKIDLDAHIDYVCYASPIAGEGVHFRPKSVAAFTEAIKDAQLFLHDNRADPVGKAAASATRGEGYREVSTPSLHVAIHSEVSSVHIDSFSFLLYGPSGEGLITPDVGQHIFDELLFRMPMPWLRRKGLDFAAAVLQALHPVLPNSTNRYSPIVGLRVDLGGGPDMDLRTGTPRLRLESTYDVGRGDRPRRWRHTATLGIAGSDSPSDGVRWQLTVKADASCGDAACHDREWNVGAFLTIDEH